MILTCPNCGTQYVVKDDAIPPEGRQVRCAACKHSWHQDPAPVATIEKAPVEAEPSAEPEPPAAAEPVGEVESPAENEGLAEATMIEPRSGPEAEERAYEEAVVADEAEAAAAAPVSPTDVEAGVEAPAETPVAEATPSAEDWSEPPHAEAAPDMFSPFAENGEVEPRRRSPFLTIMLLVLLVIALAVAFWFLAPADLKARLGLASAGTSPLQLVTTRTERTPLESGNELLTVSGRVINPSSKEQNVPPLQAQLKSRSGRVVYAWTIPPPTPSLAPGASATFNSAELKVPPGGDQLTITLGQPKA